MQYIMGRSPNVCAAIAEIAILPLIAIRDDAGRASMSHLFVSPDKLRGGVQQCAEATTDIDHAADMLEVVCSARPRQQRSGFELDHRT